MHWDTFKRDNYSTVGGDGDVGSARYELALLPPCPTIRVLSYSNCQCAKSFSHFKPPKLTFDPTGHCMSLRGHCTQAPLPQYCVFLHTVYQVVKIILESVTSFQWMLQAVQSVVQADRCSRMYTKEVTFGKMYTNKHANSVVILFLFSSYFLQLGGGGKVG